MAEIGRANQTHLGLVLWCARVLLWARIITIIIQQHSLVLGEMDSPLLSARQTKRQASRQALFVLSSHFDEYDWQQSKWSQNGRARESLPEIESNRAAPS